MIKINLLLFPVHAFQILKAGLKDNLHKPRMSICGSGPYRKPQKPLEPYFKDMQYTLIDHTADFGIHVLGSDLQNVFENAAHAMYDTITDTSLLTGINTYNIQITGDDWPDLMINWLREMLYLWTGRELLVKTADILSLSEYELTAEVKADPQVYKGQAGWESKIIFDV